MARGLASAAGLVALGWCWGTWGLDWVVGLIGVAIWPVALLAGLADHFRHRRTGEFDEIDARHPDRERRRC